MALDCPCTYVVSSVIFKILIWLLGNYNTVHIYKKPIIVVQSMDTIRRMQQRLVIPTQKGIVSAFTKTRAQSLRLVETLEYDDFIVQTAEFMSPPKWHLGHVSWLFEVVMGHANPSYQPYSDEFATYLNSYYNQFGEPHRKDRRGAVSRPTLDQILQYYTETNHRVASFLEERGDTTGLFEMAIHHECQHQELMIYDLQHLLADMYRPPVRGTPPVGHVATPEMLPIKGGTYNIGYGRDGFCYDIEQPVHRTYMDDYAIGRFPVTNGEYMRFMQDGGYKDFRYWLSDGWKKVLENGWKSPMYWENIDNTWYTRDFGGLRPVNPDEPVVHVSYYEADAYARWAGMRLPTEYEWERAACWDPTDGVMQPYPWGHKEPLPNHCNLLESHIWGCMPVGSYPEGASPCGCEQMIGDVWEWTSSEFVGYPGFVSRFQEYNDKWFTGQKVLRGGSFGTPGISIRSSYRNFFRLDERWMFAGFRLAS